MKDILFNEETQLTGSGESTTDHQRDILIMHKGWNKFFPHVGVGIMDLIDDEIEAETLKSNIVYEFERDGQRIKKIELSNGKINIDANY